MKTRVCMSRIPITGGGHLKPSLCLWHITSMKIFGESMLDFVCVDIARSGLLTCFLWTLAYKGYKSSNFLLGGVLILMLGGFGRRQLNKHIRPQKISHVTRNFSFFFFFLQLYYNGRFALLCKTII